MNHFGSQAPRHTSGPNTGPQQIVSLPRFNIHVLPPSQPRIQDYPETLDRHRVISQKDMVQRTQFPFPC
jgi:hypothetical protein